MVVTLWKSQTIKYLVARNTVDEMMWKMLNTKTDVLSRTLDGKAGESFEATDAATDLDIERCENIDPFLQSIFMTLLFRLLLVFLFSVLSSPIISDGIWESCFISV